MPKIPSYNRQVISESRERVQENVSFNANQFGGNIATAVGNAGAELSNLIIQEREAVDKIVVKEAETALKERNLIIETDPEKGLLNTRGKNSFNAPDIAEKELTSYSDELKKKLTPRQQKLFDGVSRDIKFGSKERLFKHTSRERLTYEDNVNKSYIENAKQIASFNSTDDEIVEKEIEGIKQTYYDHALRQGLDDETIKVNLRKEVSDVRKNVIENLIDQSNPESAQLNFDKFKAEMTEADADSVQKSLDEGLLAKRAQIETDKLLSSGGGVESAIRQANKIEDVKLRDEVKKRVLGAEKELAAAEAMDRENSFMDAYNRVEAKLDIYPVTTVGAARWSKLNPTQRQSLMDLYNRKGNSTDLAVFYSLRGMPRGEFIGVDLLEKKPKLSDGDFKYFAKLQADLKSGKGDALYDGIESKTSIMDNTLREAGIKFRGKGSTKFSIERANEYRAAVDAEVVAYQEKTGKKIDNEQLRIITDRLIMPIATGPNMFWGTRKKPAFEVDRDSGDIPEIRFQDIPKNEIINIRKALQSKGLSGSDGEVMTIFSKQMEKIIND